jgi:hypothetical protein
MICDKYRGKNIRPQCVKKSQNPYAFNNATNVHFLPNDILVISYTVKTLIYGMVGNA